MKITVQEVDLQKMIEEIRSLSGYGLTVRGEELVKVIEITLRILQEEIEK